MTGAGGPPGVSFTIGRIAKVDPSNDGMFRTGEVRLDERLGSLAEVTVLVPLATDDK